MAIAWVLRDPRVTSALIGASSVEQLETNVAALENLEFTDDELAEIDKYAVDAGHQHLGRVERRVNRRDLHRSPDRRTSAPRDVPGTYRDDEASLGSRRPELVMWDVVHGGAIAPDRHAGWRRRPTTPSRSRTTATLT